MSNGAGTTPFGSGPFGSGPDDGVITEAPGVSLFRKEAGESQLRIEPSNAVPSDPVGDIGTITVVEASSLAVGDYFELRDLVNPAVRFMFDNETGTITETSITRVVSYEGTETAEEIRDLCLAAIADAPALDIVGSIATTDTIQLNQPTPGPDGKGTAIEAVDDAGFSITLTEPDGSHVVCLGSDLLLPSVEDYKIGDTVSVEQDVDVTISIHALVIQARFRQPADLPIRETLPPGAQVDNVDRAGVTNLGLLTTPTEFFNDSHYLRQVSLSGSGISDGTYKILHVRNSMEAVLDGLPNSTPSTSEDVTGHVLGCHWALYVTCNEETIFILDPGYDGGKLRDWLLPDLTINVSKYTGTAAVKYELRLVETVVT